MVYKLEEELKSAKITNCAQTADLASDLPTAQVYWILEQEVLEVMKTSSWDLLIGLWRSAGNLGAEGDLKKRKVKQEWL